MAELEDLLLSIAEPPLAPRDPVSELLRRGRRRARRRRAVGTALALGCVMLVALPTFAALNRDHRPDVVRVTQTPTSLVPAPATPAKPAGRFVPSYLPEGMSLVSESESVPPSLIGGGTGRSRIYDNDPNGTGDVIATSLATDAAPLDVDAETSHYPGARRVQVQGVAALFLPPIAGRTGWVVAWTPGPGQLAQVSLNTTGRTVDGGLAGLGDDDVLALAERLRIPDLDGTPLPPGFAPRKGQANDSRSAPPPVPRQWSARYSDVVQDRGDATAVAPNAANRHSVTIASSWREGAPSGAHAPAVRGHDATAPSAPDTYSSLMWEERPGLQVTVTGERLGDDELRRVIAGLREESFDEVLARPSGTAAVVGQGDVAGKSLQLVASRHLGAICVQLRPTVGPITCGFDPAKGALSIGVTTQGAPNVVFGAARSTAKHVRIEVPGGQVVEAMTFPAADATYWLAALPDGKPLAAVVAVDASSRVVERRDVLPEPPTAPSPPWSAAKVAVGDAPAELLEAWHADGRRDGCAALALTDQGVGAGATPRIASFGPDAWAVAFDKPGLPGTTAEGRPSPDSGRSAFGIAGTSLDEAVKRVDGLPEHRIWSDGSRADYGPEGGTGPKWLAQLYVRGQRCSYNVWSAVGKEHLERLLDGIRFLEGTT